VPSINYNGLDNRYHNWITGFLQGNFGISYQDKRPVSSVVWDALRWTLVLSGSAIFIIFIIALPLGVKTAQYQGKWPDQLISTALFALYSLPNFWIATLLIVFFGGGDFLDWFPAYGVGDTPEDAPFIDRFLDTAYHFTLPLICLTYPALAFLARQMRGGMVESLSKEYIRTARAKGLAERMVVWKHAFKNSLLPIITLFGNVFPFVVTGSFVIEYIFSIPGIGKVTYDAILAQDFPLLITIVMMAAIITLIGYLIADLLYAWVDPRISYSKQDKNE
jgi:peptide/nickel transport system permease protein